MNTETEALQTEVKELKEKIKEFIKRLLEEILAAIVVSPLNLRQNYTQQTIWCLESH